MWEPGFDHDERMIARLPGYARSFCMWSIHHRGTPENPGLVLALDAVENAMCNGLALKVAAGAEDRTLDYLRERELVSSAYLEAELQIDLADGRSVDAITYVVDPDHVQYCHGLPHEEQAMIIANATGGRGPNSEYLYNTSSHLNQLGIRDNDLEWLSDRVREMARKDDA